MYSNETEKPHTLSPEALAQLGDERTVYVKEMAPNEIMSVEGLPEKLAKLPSTIKLYAVHTSDGTRVAIADNRDAAFVTARQYEMDPVSVH